jgi:hypothetical protein
MDQSESETGPELAAAQDRTPEQVRAEIEQTRAELGDTVASIAEKTDVKAQAKQAVDDAKATVSGRVSEVKGTVTRKAGGLATAAQQAAPDSAADAGQRATAFAKQNPLALSAIAAFSLGLLIGKRRGR